MLLLDVGHICFKLRDVSQNCRDLCKGYCSFSVVLKKSMNVQLDLVYLLGHRSDFSFGCSDSPGKNCQSLAGGVYLEILHR